MPWYRWTDYVLLTCGGSVTLAPTAPSAAPGRRSPAIRPAMKASAGRICATSRLSVAPAAARLAWNDADNARTRPPTSAMQVDTPAASPRRSADDDHPGSPRRRPRRGRRGRSPGRSARGRRRGPRRPRPSSRRSVARPAMVCGRSRSRRRGSPLRAIAGAGTGAELSISTRPWTAEP